MGEYKNRCLAAGGTITNVSGGGVKCRLPSGATVTCYDTSGPGISCDYRTAGNGGPPRILGTPGSMNPGNGNSPPKAGNGPSTVNDSTGGSGKGNVAPGAGAGASTMNGDSGPAID
jgi:hypothetical protein